MKSAITPQASQPLRLRRWAEQSLLDFGLTNAVGGEDDRWTARRAVSPLLALLFGWHFDLRDSDRVTTYIAGHLDSMAGVFLQASEVLVANVVDFSTPNEYILGIVVFDACQRAVSVRHLLGAMLGRRVVLCT